jgi:hypothetical protein
VSAEWVSRIRDKCRLAAGQKSVQDRWWVAFASWIYMANLVGN